MNKLGPGRPVLIGADIGTQGVRVAAVSDRGELLASQSRPFPLGGAREEQDPAMWWEGLVECLSGLVKALKRTDSDKRIEALSVTSTSGTMIPLDRSFAPLGPALMYSDPRSFGEAERCREAARQSGAEGYQAFNASSGLPKILWFTSRYPELAERIKLWAHAADYIIGKLSGEWGVTDYSNSLKTGYDLSRGQWPAYIHDRLGVPAEWLPEVVPPGTPIGTVGAEAQERTGLPAWVKVVAGMTDGCASQIASGAIRPGDWNTTIGTTMVVKGVTREPVADPHGRLYNHKHPQGYWMPGGASNTGGDWVSRDYAGMDLEAMNRAAESLLPTPWICYPLLQEGERFPFVCGQARGFDHEELTPTQRFAARMEGVAYLERLAYEMIESLSGEKVKAVYTAGGASNSIVWLRIRSTVLGRPVRKLRHTEGAVGAAVLAASGVLFPTLGEAGAAMGRQELLVEPWGGPSVGAQYEEQYERFLEQLRMRGYIDRQERA